MRQTTLGPYYFGDPERSALLDVTVTASDPGDYWTPPWPGSIEPEVLWIDGDRVDMSAHRELVREIIENEPIPRDDDYGF